ncbi:TonB-dependent receptor [Sphingomonas cavernae]|uniref:TonB-dependent receptor n=1 Tax=Sphingomonas cavernae TaxID=2320861 RepID=A0A418WLG3_9SPHN|nr:TonB-dependent receptor [Sphingomonas cavernae]RJF90840.1 TonB-dependent receptor [Sphingomonas cavernae]
MTKGQLRPRAGRWGLLAATMLATSMASAAFAQTEAPGQDVPQAAPAEDEIIVTGFRKSLQESADLKRDSVGFIDAISAEDIGKFPDTNIAESFNRIPGITITREITGEGVQVAIRGLGTNFTKVLLNGAPVAVSSTGRTDAQSTNREVDLDLFPTELFSSLTVIKTSMASMLEGGAAGTVNMRSARPFDNPGKHLTYSLQGTKNSNADSWGYRGSLIGSATFGDFGILAGAAYVKNKVRVTGFETIGWTNPNLSAAQCGATSGCNSTGGGNWTIPGTVPANAGNGLTTGATIDRAFLLANNPGLTIQQIDNAIIPRLGRPSDEFGSKERLSAIVSLEYRPADSLRFYVDSMYGRKENDLERIDMNWVGRNGASIPLNMKVDRTDCAAGCVVTEGTFANAQWFLEYRPFIEDVEFWGVNPGFEWDISDKFKLDISGNWTESKFHRESPSVLVSTVLGSGVTVDYLNSGSVPTISTNIDLNNPANFGWNAGSRVNIQDERRKTETKGVRGNLTYGDEELNLRVGGAYDDISRRIRAFDNSQAWQNAVCGNNPNVFLPNPNTQPQCRGLNAPGGAAAGDPTYPLLGSGFSAGMGPLVYQGSLIPTAALPSYLRAGPSGFVTVDWDRFKADTNYDAFHDGAPEVGAANTGASGGFVREKTTGAYMEVNGNTDLGGNALRWNIGLRYVHTDQTIGGNVSIPDPRNSRDPDGAGPLPAACPGGGNLTPPNPRDGSCFPNIVNFATTNNTYDNWLPSATVSYNVSENALVRFALSKTMTRPDPNAMLPGLNFSTPSADVGTVGNSALKPFISKNIDFGFEYYTGGPGYVSVAAFRKSVTGFTVPGTATVPFTDLAQYGVTFDTLTPAQQTAINARGGPNVATVVLQQQVNASGSLTVNGLEFGWVQPLDFLLSEYGMDGFGFTANLTIIDQKGKGAAPAVALGVAPYTWNATAYYENHGISARISMTHADGSQVSGLNQNGIPSAALFSDDYEQWDFSSSFDLSEILDSEWAPELTFDVVNIFDADQRTYFQFPNATFTRYKPGTQFMVGLRGRF